MLPSTTMVSLLQELGWLVGGSSSLSQAVAVDMGEQRCHQVLHKWHERLTREQQTTVV